MIVFNEEQQKLIVEMWKHRFDMGLSTDDIMFLNIQYKFPNTPKSMSVVRFLNRARTSYINNILR